MTEFMIMMKVGFVPLWCYTWNVLTCMWNALTSEGECALFCY